MVILKAYIEVLHEKLGEPISKEELESLYNRIKDNPAMKKVVESFPPELASLPYEEIKREIHRVLDDSPEAGQLLEGIFKAEGKGYKAPGLPGKAASDIKEAEQVESWFEQFKQEKWIGKKGLTVVGTTVVLGAVIYGAKKYLDHNKQHDAEPQTWRQRVDQQAISAKASPNALQAS